MDIQQYDHIPLTLSPNLLDIPKVQMDITDEGMAKINEVYNYLRENYGDYERLRRTKSGGICTDKNYFRLPSWGIRCTATMLEIIALIKEGCYRFYFKQSHLGEGQPIVEGREAYFALYDAFAADGIDLQDYGIHNGQEVKAEIESPMISLDRAIPGLIYENAYHIDKNQSYWGEILKVYPEFRPAIEKLYHERKQKPKNKYILNAGVGYFQSVMCCGAKWAHLSKIAINGNNAEVRKKAAEVRELGHVILAYNTDGFWAINPREKEEPFDGGENAGTEIGQWKIDHRGARIRFKSAGAYEYQIGDEYTPVVRGRTGYDTMVPRSEWKWGDIFRQESRVAEYKFDRVKGVYKT